MKTSNHKARDYVVARKPFTASNLFAETWHDVYVVFSYRYSFPIYAFINGRWYANKEKYSRSTSRHQMQARPEYEGDKMVWVTTEELRRLIIA